jgi:hypothetical protein
VTADCPSPLVCVGGQCAGPNASGIVCGPDITCPTGTTCIAAVCQAPAGTCTRNDDCPVGFVCAGGSCNPDATAGCASDAACGAGQVCVGGACVDTTTCKSLGTGPDLTGANWQTVSQLHLGEAVPGAMAALLDVAQALRNILAGNEDFGLPSWAGALVDGVIASLITSYVPAWGVQLINTLGDVADILSNIQVNSTMTLDGSAGCNGSYRGTETWDTLTFNYKGVVTTARPQDIPEIGMVQVEPFAARYVCGTLFIDRHRVNNIVTGIIRWVADTVTYETTGYNTVDDAINNIVDCSGFSYALDADLGSVCPACPSVQGLVQTGCQTELASLVSEIDNALAAPTSLDLMKIKGMANVQDMNHLVNGRWYGSLLGGDFTGDFTSTQP